MLVELWVMVVLSALTLVSDFRLSVAATIRKRIVKPGVVDHRVVFDALIGAVTWIVMTRRYGTPSSRSHALIVLA